jgi:hypothetical protein
MADSETRYKSWPLLRFGVWVLGLTLLGRAISVAQPSLPPTISSIPDQLVYPTATNHSVDFVVGDVEGGVDSLVLAGFSSNSNLLASTNIVFGGAGSNRTATLNFTPSRVGTSLVSVVVTDLDGLTATNSFVFESAYFTGRAVVLAGGNNGVPFFADYDGDGDYDLYLGGTIYRNDGGLNFTNVATVISTTQRGEAWGDYDRDGDLDLVVDGGGQTKIYRNDGGDVFTDIGADIPDAGNGAMAWGDYDNDGDLDLLFCANGRIYRNDNGVFVAGNVVVAAVGESGAAWGDYDSDGDLDLLVSGFQGPSTVVGAIYRNNGNGTFSNIGAGIAGLRGASVAWGDYDNDGWLDAAVSGKWVSWEIHIYHNNHDGTFTEINLGLWGTAYGSLQWLDLDNDGYLDLFLCGYVDQYPNLDYAARVYRNNQDGTFSDLQAGLPKSTLAAWADIDGDGDLDFLLSGDGIGTYRFFRNNDPASNAPPVAPAGLMATLLPDNNVALSWLPAADVENTNPASLNYALRAGNVSGGVNLVSPHADGSSGFRRLPARGPLNTNTWFLRDVPKGTYYWSVQAIDAGWAGSPFSAEGTFAITNARPLISAISNQFTVPGHATPPVPFMISDVETPATNLVLSGSSTNTTLVPNGNIVFGGSESNRTVTVMPATGQSGTTTIVVGVADAGGLVATSRFDVVVQTFLEVSAGLPSNSDVPTVWGDFDNDGDLDVALTSPNYTTVYRNTGGLFTNLNFTLPAASYYKTPTDMAWIDFDNDGDLDLVESGWVSSGYQPVTFRFRNNFPANTFTSISTNLPGGTVTNIADGAMAWADYDGDGDLDVVLSGDTNTYHSPDAWTMLARNDSGMFTNSGVMLPPLVKGAAVWGDYDNDGDLDLLIAGQTGGVATNSLARLFRNDGNDVFTPITTSFPGVTDCALAFADIDNDGDLDVAIAGTGTNSVPLTRIYRNLGNGVFTNLNASLIGVTFASLAWGDYDNDGFVDLVVSGSTNTSIYNISAATTTVYRNYGGLGFTNIGGTLPGVMLQSVSWGDYDNDGDLDLLVGTHLLRNNWNIPDTPPSAPTNLATVILPNNEVRFGWSKSMDAETVRSNGLNYNLRVGTTPGGSQIVSPQADPGTGYRRVPNSGNAGQTNFWRIANLTNGTYYWSVQAIDSALVGSPFAAESTLTLSRPIISAITNRSTPPNTNTGPISFTVNDAETAASNLIVTVTSSDTNLVPTAGLVLAGTDGDRSLTITPVTNRSGAVTITIVALDESGQIGGRSFVLTVERFGEIAAGLTSAGGPVAWGDFDNDGRLDLANGPTVYRNIGNNIFTNIGVILAYNDGVAGWADYDNDDNLDLLAVGPNGCVIYRTDGNGNFTDIGAGLPAAGLSRQSGAWGDYDNDGDFDILLATGSFTRIYRNNGTNIFTDIAAGLPAAGYGAAAWADYDRDGDLDILLAGNGLLRLYRNNGNGSFTDLSLGQPGLYYASAAWGDYDNDGYLDFVVAGSTNNGVSGVVTRIYHSTTNVAGAGRVFTSLYPVATQGPVGTWKGTVTWGDYDNDGDLDLLVTGQITNSAPLTKVYRNDNGNFVDSGHALPALRGSYAAWGDFDGDGNLDLAVSGVNASSDMVSRIFRNFPTVAANTNLPPNAPAGLTNVVAGKSVRLSWTAATDANQAAGLTYNLRLGSTPGAGNIVNPLSHPDGVRKVVARGNADERLSWTITNLTGGVFYWSVQAVDASFAGSPFAAERSFTVTNREPVTAGQSITMLEDTSTNLTLAGSDPDGDPLSYNVASPPHFGSLIGTPPNLTYRPITNYFGLDHFAFRANDRTTNSEPALVFIEVKPVPDVSAARLGIQPPTGGPLVITINAEPWNKYRLEASEDLVHWVTLTNLLCTNLLTQLIDADAARYPRRFYRSSGVPFDSAFAPGLTRDQQGFHFSIVGEVGRIYQVRYSSNLVNWFTLDSMLLTNSPMLFLDVGATNSPQRFYRVIGP